MFTFFSKQNEPATPSMAAGDSPSLGSDHNAELRIGRAMTIIIYLLAFLVPLFSLPYTQDPLFAKVVFVECAAVLLGLLWLVRVVLTRKVSYMRGPWNVPFFFIGLVLILASVFSEGHWQNFWGNDTTGEKTASVLAFILIAWVSAAVLSREGVRRGLTIFFSSLGLLGVYTLVSLILGHFGNLPAWLGVNPIGTVNGLAYVLAIGFLASFLLVAAGSTPRAHALTGSWLSRIAMITSVVLILSLVLLGFRALWVSIAALIVIFLGLNLWKRLRRHNASEDSLGATAIAIAVIVLAASVFLAWKPIPFSQIYQPPVEVSPSLSATLAIDVKVLGTHPILGLGPSNFTAAFSRFRDPLLNATVFWNARFNHGFSFLTTLPSTVGILGTIAFLLLMVGMLRLLKRAFSLRSESDSVTGGLGIGVLFILVMWCAYSGNFTAGFLLFLLVGFLGAYSRESGITPSGAAPEPRRALSGFGFSSSIAPRTIAVTSPLLNFVLTLALVFFAVLGLVSIYGIGAAYAAEVWFLQAVQVMNRYGNVDSAKVFLDRAIALNPTESSYYQGRAQVAVVAVSRIIQQAQTRPNQDVSGQFRAELSAGINAGNQATQRAPDNPQNWFSLGSLYETVIPFVGGADDAGRNDYAKARELDPSNPAFAFAIGRLDLTRADLYTFQINQTASGSQRSKLEAERARLMQQAKRSLEASAALKSDYAQAHFLLAQIAIRENNLAEAIKRTEATFQLASNDVGVAFQLGVLYYTAGDFDRAKAAFDRAVALNDNYSNARYFLGLIWDKKGDHNGALSQFQKIAALNPDNEEVKTIIANLESGKPALFGIVPPGTAPEKRKGAPIKEGESSKPLERAPAKR